MPASSGIDMYTYTPSLSHVHSLPILVFSNFLLKPHIFDLVLVSVIERMEFPTGRPIVVVLVSSHRTPRY